MEKEGKDRTDRKEGELRKGIDGWCFVRVVVVIIVDLAIMLVRLSFGNCNVKLES